MYMRLQHYMWVVDATVCGMLISEHCTVLFVLCCAVLCRAMGGSVLFQDALASRLNIMGLSRQRLDDFLKAHPAQITPGAW